MKRLIFAGILGFSIGAAFMFFAYHLSADETGKGSFVRVSDMEWKGQESHGPKTALKWIAGRESNIPTEAIASFWMTTVGVGGFNKPSSHTDEEQIYYILDGVGRMVVGDREIPVKAGDLGYFPKGTRHGLYNEGDKPIVFIGVGAKVKPVE